MIHRSAGIRRRRVLGGWLPSLMALAAMLFAGLVGAETYPSKPVRVIVPFSPGSAGDVSARIIAQKLTESMKQSFVVELRPGANSIIGTEAAAKATPDGYTLILGSIGSHGINPSLVSKLPYDPVKDFAPIAYVGSTPYLLTVGGNSPVGSIKDLVAQAKAEPGKRTLGYMASFGQLVGELFKLTARIDVTLVPYKNVSDAYVDQANGQLDGLFNSTASSLPPHQGGASQGPGHDLDQALAIDAGCAHRRGIGLSRFRGHWLGRVLCSGRHPEGHHRPAVPRNRARRAEPRGHGKAAAKRPRSQCRIT